ncbi:MAG: UvrD-helicase domain-containing protein [Candidatus Sericytochromatia bacterium]|nr:UvrD-helicase domain-containing protein [Candidatus Sericytochromatia bacterium]
MTCLPASAPVWEADGDLVVTAGAGAGKTYMLQKRFAHHLEVDGLSPLAIVAVTFTELAAAELRARVREEVRARVLARRAQGLTGGPLDAPGLLGTLEAAPISTIHALAARICREHPDEAEVPREFAILDERDGVLWQAEHLEAALAALPPALFEHLPWAKARAVLAALLRDPHLTAQALRVPLPDLAADASEADHRLAAVLPVLREAWDQVSAGLRAEKMRQRRLDYADLELGALRALSHDAVRAYYHARWRAVIVDEFQDTNPVQAELLRHLTAPRDGTRARLTIVGDEKQSIFGFRRADPRVFQDFQADLAARGRVGELAESRRTHAPLMALLNAVCGPLLPGVRVAMGATRQAAPAPAPHLEVLVLDAAARGRGALPAELRRRLEADRLARHLRAMLDRQPAFPVHDRHAERRGDGPATRPLTCADIAVLARSWSSLEVIGEALAAQGLPAVQTRGGNLLETREALDALALLTWLARPAEDQALVAVLRSPFFAVDDGQLARLAAQLPPRPTDEAQAAGAPPRPTDEAQADRTPPRPTDQKQAARTSAPERPRRAWGAWWQAIEHSPDGAWQAIRDVLRGWLAARRTLAPSALLARADHDRGYTAVAATMPGGRRRLADWQGVVALVRDLERGTEDVGVVVRRLRQLLAAGVTIERPPLEAGEAISLLTIHAAKGLEWPVVAVVDLARANPNDVSEVRLDAELGVALRLGGSDSEDTTPARFRALGEQRKAAEAEERRRLLYVALTRARDHLVLSAAARKGPLLDLLAPGVQAAGLAPALARPELARGRPPELPPHAWPQGLPALLEACGPGLEELPVTALAEYARCPARFRFSIVERHPPEAPPGAAGSPQRVHPAALGTLVHAALEHDVRDPEALARLASRLGSPLAGDATALGEAAALVARFHAAPAFAALDAPRLRQEVPFRKALGPLELVGKIDAVGPDFVLDYKTDREVNPDHHLLQLAVYAWAAGVGTACLAFVRHDHLHRFDATALEGGLARAQALVEAIARGDFAARPTREACGECPYVRLCEACHPEVQAMAVAQDDASCLWQEALEIDEPGEVAAAM